MALGSETYIERRLGYQAQPLQVDYSVATAETGKLMLLAATNLKARQLLQLFNFHPDTWTMDNPEAIQEANQALEMAQEAQRIQNRVRGERNDGVVVPEPTTTPTSLESLLTIIMRMPATA